MNQVDYVTKNEFATGIGRVEASIADLKTFIAELAESMTEGFAHIEEKKADKTDIARMEALIRQGNEDLREELSAFTSDIYDELSGRISALEARQ